MKGDGRQARTMHNLHAAILEVGVKQWYPGCCLVHAPTLLGQIGCVLVPRHVCLRLLRRLQRSRQPDGDGGRILTVDLGAQVPDCSAMRHEMSSGARV